MDILKNIIKVLAPFLKQLGFSKKGNNFYLEVDKNFGVVNFQKSRDSTQEVALFTINFGIYANVLGRFEYRSNGSDKPGVTECQWQSRVGHFMPGSPDYWWKINISDNLSGITNDISEIFKGIIMPELKRRLSDEGLIQCWLSDCYAGTTEVGRFKCLSTLLKIKGDFNTLDEVVETFMQQSKGKPNAILGVEHLKDIGYIK